MYLTITKKEKVYLEQFYSILTGLFLFMYLLHIFHKYLSILGVVRSGSIPQKEFLNDILILTRHSKQHNI